jgi:hypothetical protein
MTAGDDGLLAALPPELLLGFGMVVGLVVLLLLWKIFKLALRLLAFGVFLLFVLGAVAWHHPDLLGAAAEAAGVDGLPELPELPDLKTLPGLLEPKLDINSGQRPTTP